jgi:hypothetical protein
MSRLQLRQSESLGWISLIRDLPVTRRRPLRTVVDTSYLQQLPLHSSITNETGHTTLNLARLGLATRQIPLGALQKLGKNGSGASKDVFKGSLHGRLIAISQFRDRPTACA